MMTVGGLIVVAACVSTMWACRSRNGQSHPLANTNFKASVFSLIFTTALTMGFAMMVVGFVS